MLAAELVYEGDGGLAGYGEGPAYGAAEVRVLVKQSAILRAQGQVLVEVVVDAGREDTNRSEGHGGDESEILVRNKVFGVRAAVDGQKSERAGSSVEEAGEAWGDVALQVVGDAGLVDVAGDGEVRRRVVSEGAGVDLRGAGVAKVDGVSEPGGNALTDGAKESGGGIKTLGAVAAVLVELDPRGGELGGYTEGDGCFYVGRGSGRNVLGGGIGSIKQENDCGDLNMGTPNSVKGRQRDCAGVFVLGWAIVCQRYRSPPEKVHGRQR